MDNRETAACPRCGKESGEGDVHTCTPGTTTRDNELASIAASQCHGGYGDEFGNWRCKYQDEIERLQAAVKMYEADYVKRF